MATGVTASLARVENIQNRSSILSSEPCTLPLPAREAGIFMLHSATSLVTCSLGSRVSYRPVRFKWFVCLVSPSRFRILNWFIAFLMAKRGSPLAHTVKARCSLRFNVCTICGKWIRSVMLYALVNISPNRHLLKRSNIIRPAVSEAWRKELCWSITSEYAVENKFFFTSHNLLSLQPSLNPLKMRSSVLNPWQISGNLELGISTPRLSLARELIWPLTFGRLHTKGWHAPTFLLDFSIAAMFCHTSGQPLSSRCLC